MPSLFAALLLILAWGSADVRAQGTPAAPAAPEAADTTPLPEVIADPAKLPPAVRAMRDRISAAALSGDPERLREVVKANPQPPAFSFAEDGKDPIQALKEQSNDGEGLEIMAILSVVLDMPPAHVDVGTPEEMYVWPYFAAHPVDDLTPAQMIQLFRLITVSEFKDMQEFGAYNFYCVGIGPDGMWHFFVAGD